VNLRGKNPDATWYIEEIKVSAEQNAAHYHISLSTFQEPNKEDVQKLLEIQVFSCKRYLIRNR
jgi:hypothetical protein